jgi:superfamily II DNA helicase RecQ
MVNRFAIRISLCRRNIHLIFLPRSQHKKVIAAVAELVKKYRSKAPKTIVFAKSFTDVKNHMELFQDSLREKMFIDINGQRKALINVYNAEMKDNDRLAVEKSFSSVDTCDRVLIGTSAIGQGVHIPDVRLVLAFHDGNFTETFQNVGRAGRDGCLALGFVFMKEVPKKCFWTTLLEPFSLNNAESVNINGSISFPTGQVVCNDCICCSYCSKICDKCTKPMKYMLPGLQL